MLSTAVKPLELKAPWAFKAAISRDEYTTCGGVTVWFSTVTLYRMGGEMYSLSDEARSFEAAQVSIPALEWRLLVLHGLEWLMVESGASMSACEEGIEEPAPMWRVYRRCDGALLASDTDESIAREQARRLRSLGDDVRLAREG